MEEYDNKNEIDYESRNSTIPDCNNYITSNNQTMSLLSQIYLNSVHILRANCTKTPYIKK